MAVSNRYWIAPMAIIAIVAVIGIFWFVGQQNSFVTLEEQIGGAWTEVDNQLQQRSDLIPNLVATVQGFAGQEQQVYRQIADARARLAGAMSVSETAASYTELQGALSQLLVIAENDPQLASNADFARLQEELADAQNQIMEARERYNISVDQFNTRVRFFPSRIVANRLSLRTKEFL